MPSEKKLEQKKKQVDQLVKELKSAESIVLTDYKGQIGRASCRERV